MSIFKETINSKVSDSLSLRQELMGKENRTQKELTYLNSKTSWVSLKSAINVDDKPDLAKSNVLEGGSINNGKLRYGVGTDSSKAYSLNNTLGEKNVLGIRPMPGITSVTIENIGAYGSTRRATINYQCWDVKQLEVLEQLYMRPGYLALLEFGRTTYLQNENGINNIKQITSDYDFFSKSDIVLLDELRALYNKTIESEGNYDAFLGYVVNYGWQVRDDGGYDCKTELISTGEILESLKTNYSLAANVDFGGIDAGNSKFRGLLFPQFKDTGISVDDLKLINQDYSNNILSGVIRELYLLGKYNNDDVLKPAPSTKYKLPVTLNGNTFDIDLIYTYYDSPEGDPAYKLQAGHDQNYYITLESFTELINNLIIPHSYNAANTKNGALTKISVKDREYLGHKDQLLNCLYNVLMTSVDPDVCIIKNEYWLNVLQNTNITVNINPIQPIPPGNPDLQTTEAIALQKKIAGWVSQLANRKNLVNIDKTIIENISVDLKKWKGTEDQYFKHFQKNYQIVRGGVNTEVSTTTSEIITGEDGQRIRGGETITNTFYTRAWNYNGDIRELRSILRGKYSVKEDIQFINLLDPSITNGGTPDFKKVVDGLNKKTNNTALDLQLNTQQNTVNQAIENAKKAEEVKTTLQKTASNYKLFLNQIPNSFVTPNNEGRKFGIIGNIYLNLKYLYKLADDPNLKTQDSSEKSTIQLTQFIKTMIKDVQTSIGNVNNFELHIDDRDGIGRIIDLNYVSREGSPFKFEIGSNKSIIRNLKLESKIFSDQSSMIAISAQGDSGKLGLDNSTLVAFNKGITDRLVPKKDSPSIINQDQQINNLVSSLSGLVNQFFKSYMGDYWNNKGTYNATNGTSYKDYLRDIIVFFSDKFNTDNKNSMLLPTQISFTLDGVAGLVIGNLFTVDKTFIPKSYKDTNKDLGYIIVKVGHQIQNNDWVTNVDGYPYIPEVDSQISNPSPDVFNLIVNYEPSTGGSSITVSSASPITTKQQNANILKIYNTLKNWYGLSQEQAAGIIGNALRESSLNPTAKTIDSNGLPSGGIFQWNGIRYDKLVAKYPNWTNIDNQLNYLKSELDTTYKNIINMIKTTTKVEDSNYIWASEFERCKECVKGKNTSEITTRLRFSLQALDVIQHPEKYIK